MKKALENKVLAGLIAHEKKISDDQKKIQRKQKEKLARLKTIKDHLYNFLKEDKTVCHPYGRLTGNDMINIIRVLNEEDNYMIFDNAGGKAFTIWFYDDFKKRDKKTTLKDFEGWMKKQQAYLYMYKIRGKETIVRHLP